MRVSVGSAGKYHRGFLLGKRSFGDRFSLAVAQVSNRFAGEQGPFSGARKAPTQKPRSRQHRVRSRELRLFPGQ